MEETVHVTLIANAGVLLEYRGTTLLLDGIYGAEGHPFSNLSADVWKGSPPLRPSTICSFPTHIPITVRRG